MKGDRTCDNCKHPVTYVIKQDRYACFNCDVWTEKECNCWNADEPDPMSMGVFGRPCPFPKCPEKPSQLKLTARQKLRLKCMSFVGLSEI